MTKVGPSTATVKCTQRHKENKPDDIIFTSILEGVPIEGTMSGHVMMLKYSDHDVVDTKTPQLISQIT